MGEHAARTSFLDQFPAWLRHLAIVVAIPVLDVAVQVPTKGWHWADFTAAGNVATGAAAAYLLLLLTPLTRQYGLFRSDTAPRIR